MTEFEKDVYEAVMQIPYGKVATYGQIAEMAGHPGASRAVGNALHANPNPEKIKCYRVVNSKGRLSRNFAFSGPDEQKKRLQEEKIEVYSLTVDLKKYGI